MISLSDHVYSHKQTLMGHLQQLQLISIFPSPHSLKLYRLLTLYNLKTWNCQIYRHCPVMFVTLLHLAI